MWFPTGNFTGRDSEVVVMAEAVIVAGARTPIGKLSGALAGFTAMELGGFAIAEALKRAGVAPDQVDYVLMGQVLQAGQGQITARQAAVKAGIPLSVPANTINKVCLSGCTRSTWPTR
jgi:acetyl-CoA C-acetyltransferase